MEYRFLGSSGLKVSELCFGVMTFGGTGDWDTVGSVQVDEAREQIAIAMDAGVNFFDTADIYANGRSEEVLGKALGPLRKDVVIATKAGFGVGDGPNDTGATRHRIIAGCEASLRRLQTDHIDLYQIHCYDPVTPQEETLRALDDLVRHGKVRYIGCSNFTGWQLMKALAISERQNLEKYITHQSLYNLLSRGLEYELVPLSEEEGLGILTWSPLEGGFLTGKYRRGEAHPSGTRLRNDDDHFTGFDADLGYAVIDELEKIADAHEATIPQAALNWLRRKPCVTSIVIGARNEDQLRDNLGCVDWDLTDEEFQRLDSVTKPPPVYPYWFIEESRDDRWSR